MFSDGRRQPQRGHGPQVENCCSRGLSSSRVHKGNNEDRALVTKPRLEGDMGFALLESV